VVAAYNTTNYEDVTLANNLERKVQAPAVELLR
jgi:hypothetical protein